MNVKLSETNQNILEALIGRAKRNELIGAFEGIPIEVYHHPLCPGISSTMVKKIVEKSYDYAIKNPFKRTPAMEFGTAFHTFMEGEVEFYNRYSVGSLVPGKGHISFTDFAGIKTMADNVRSHPVAGPLLEGGDPERTFFAPCPVTEVLRKCRPDRLKSNIMLDYKSCHDASPIGFARQARTLFYRISAKYYLDTANEALIMHPNSIKFDQFKFIAVENEEQHAVCVYDPDDRSMEKAEYEIIGALRSISNARSQGWTGYPLYQDPISI